MHLILLTLCLLLSLLMDCRRSRSLTSFLSPVPPSKWDT